MHSTLVGLITLVVATTIGAYSCLSTAATLLLGLDFFDVQCTVNLDCFDRHNCCAAIDFLLTFECLDCFNAHYADRN